MRKRCDLQKKVVIYRKKLNCVIKTVIHHNRFKILWKYLETWETLLGMETQEVLKSVVHSKEKI